MAITKVHFHCLLAALALAFLTAFIWPSKPVPHFDGPKMSFQYRTASSGPSCMARPDRNDMIIYERSRADCSKLQTALGKVFDPAEAVSDANIDLQESAFRLIGRTDKANSQILIPGIECASTGLRKALYPSACLVVVPGTCNDFPAFDAYAKAYNTAAISNSSQSSLPCK